MNLTNKEIKFFIFYVVLDVVTTYMGLSLGFREMSSPTAYILGDLSILNFIILFLIKFIIFLILISLRNDKKTFIKKTHNIVLNFVLFLSYLVVFSNSIQIILHLT